MLGTRQSCSGTARPKCPQCGKFVERDEDVRCIVDGKWTCLHCGFEMKVQRITRFSTSPIGGWPPEGWPYPRP